MRQTCSYLQKFPAKLVSLRVPPAHSPHWPQAQPDAVVGPPSPLPQPISYPVLPSSSSSYLPSSSPSPFVAVSAAELPLVVAGHLLCCCPYPIPAAGLSTTIAAPECPSCANLDCCRTFVAAPSHTAQLQSASAKAALQQLQKQQLPCHQWRQQCKQQQPCQQCQQHNQQQPCQQWRQQTQQQPCQQC